MELYPYLTFGILVLDGQKLKVFVFVLPSYRYPILEEREKNYDRQNPFGSKSDIPPHESKAPNSTALFPLPLGVFTKCKLEDKRDFG